MARWSTWGDWSSDGYACSNGGSTIYNLSLYCICICICICIVLTVDLQSFFVYIRIIAGNRNRHGPVKSIVIDFSDYQL